MLARTGESRNPECDVVPGEKRAPGKIVHRHDCLLRFIVVHDFPSTMSFESFAQRWNSVRSYRVNLNSFCAKLGLVFPLHSPRVTPTSLLGVCHLHVCVMLYICMYEREVLLRDRARDEEEHFSTS